MIPPPIVAVTWVDSSSHGTPWAGLGEVKRDGENLVCHSVGLLIQETDTNLTIAHSYTLNSSGTDIDEVCGALTIPRCAVSEVRRLKR